MPWCPVHCCVQVPPWRRLAPGHEQTQTGSSSASSVLADSAVSHITARMDQAGLVRSMTKRRLQCLQLSMLPCPQLLLLPPVALSANGAPYRIQVSRLSTQSTACV